VENGTLNYTFSVPTSSAGSNAVQMSVKLTTAPTFTTPETYNFVTLTGNHQYTRIGSVKIKANGLLPDPQKIAPGVSDRFIKGGMPFPVGSPQHILFDETVYPYVGNPIGVTEAPAVLLGLEKLRKNMKPCVGYLHGWAKISQMPLNGVSCGGSRTIDCHVGMSKDKEENMQRVFSHEFTHEILDNNGHPSDPTYIDQVGFDVRMRTGWLNFGRIKIGAGDGAKQDYMVSGKTTLDSWVSKTTYEAVMAAVQMSLPITCSDVEALSISVSPDLTQISGVFGETRNTPPLVVGATGIAELKLRDINGALLYQTKFDDYEVEIDEPGAPSVQGIPVLSIPRLPNGKTLELYKNGVLQDSVAKTANSPVVSISSPLPGASLGSSVTIQWQATDSDGDPLLSTVLFSKDGVEWIPLQAEIPGTSITVGTAGLAATGQGIIRVVVSDGFNTTTVDSAGLSLGPNRAPRASMLQPSSGDFYSAGANVLLMGESFDLEDGVMPESAIQWTSSINGYLGSGYAVNTTSLSIGTHQIQMTVTDSGGATTSMVAVIVIQ